MLVKEKACFKELENEEIKRNGILVSPAAPEVSLSATNQAIHSEVRETLKPSSKLSLWLQSY